MCNIHIIFFMRNVCTVNYGRVILYIWCASYELCNCMIYMICVVCVKWTMYIYDIYAYIFIYICVPIYMYTIYVYTCYINDIVAGSNELLVQQSNKYPTCYIYDIVAGSNEHVVYMILLQGVTNCWCNKVISIQHDTYMILLQGVTNMLYIWYCCRE